MSSNMHGNSSPAVAECCRSCFKKSTDAKRSAFLQQAMGLSSQ